MLLEYLKMNILYKLTRFVKACSIIYKTNCGGFKLQAIFFSYLLHQKQNIINLDRKKSISRKRNLAMRKKENIYCDIFFEMQPIDLIGILSRSPLLQGNIFIGFMVRFIKVFSLLPYSHAYHLYFNHPNLFFLCFTS